MGVTIYRDIERRLVTDMAEARHVLRRAGVSNTLLTLSCLIQLEGIHNGRRWYYRSRDWEWSLHITEDETTDPLDVGFRGTPGRVYEGDDPGDHMGWGDPLAAAERIIKHLGAA